MTTLPQSNSLNSINTLRNSTLGHGLIHGDAMPGNAILSGGRLIMIDLDSVGLGAREWDLVPMAVVAQRFSKTKDRWHAFLAGYGVDEASLPGLQAASVIKQLTMTAYLCLSAGQSPAIDEEIRRRLTMWADWDLDGRWGSGFIVNRPD